MRDAWMLAHLMSPYVKEGTVLKPSDFYRPKGTHWMSPEEKREALLRRAEKLDRRG